MKIKINKRDLNTRKVIPAGYGVKRVGAKKGKGAYKRKSKYNEVYSI